MFGRHVFGRTHHDAGACQPPVHLAAGFQLGDAEVEQLHAGVARVVLGDHHVVGLEVAVNDAFSVRRADAIDDLHHEVKSFAVTQRSTGVVVVLVEGLQAAPLHVLHHHVGQTVGTAVDIAYLHNVRALDPCRYLGFLQETFDQALAPSQHAMKKLQGDIGAEQFVLGRKDRAHAPVADQSQQAVLVVDELSDFWVHAFCRLRSVVGDGGKCVHLVETRHIANRC